MKKITFPKRCLALLLALSMVISGVTISKKNAAAAEEPQEQNAVVTEIPVSTTDEFKSALNTANTSENDVVIKLLADIEVDTVSIINDVTIDGTVDGNKHTITLKNGYHGIQIDSVCTVEFKNLDIVHKQAGVAVVINDAAAGSDVKMTDVYIDATQPTDNYNWAILNIHGNDASKQTKLTLSNVDIDMKANALSNNPNKAILRTGNDGATKNVLISLDNCEWNATEATERSGIAIISGTTATVNINNSTISTKDACPILDTTGAATINKTNCTLSSTDKVAQIGTEVYADLISAATDVNNSSEAVTIELLNHITISGDGVGFTKPVTINGNGYTVTTTAKHAIRIYYAGAVKLQNMKLICDQEQSAIQVNANAELELRDIKITAKTTGTTNFMYGLIAIAPNTATKATLNLYNVDVLMELGDTYGANSHAIIRTGNPAGYDIDREVTINLEDCDWDLTKAPNRHGIAIMGTTTATVNVKNSTFSTKNVSYFIDQKGASTITKTNCTLSSTDIVAQIGTSTFTDLASALREVNNSSKAVTLELLKDITISGDGVGITQSVTINGNGHTVTTTAKHAIKIYYAGAVKLQNMKLNCNQEQSAIQVCANAELELRDIEITAKTTGTTNFQYGLILIAANTAPKATLNLYNVDVLMELGDTYGANAHAIIRTGNPVGYDIDREVTINLEDCDWDLTKAPNRHGVVIMGTTTATVNVKNSTFSTKNVSSFIDQKGASTITKSNCLFTCTDAVAQIGETPYFDFSTALNSANAGDTITLQKDITIATFNITKDLTIDGNGKMLTFAVADNSNHGITVNAACTLELKNMDIVHNKAGSITQIYSAGADVRLTNVDVYANTAANYTHTLFNMLGKSDELVTKLSLDTVTVTMATNGTASDNAPAIIRTGNGGEGKKVQITIKDSTLDTTGASGRYGIVIMPATNATVNLEKSTITTKDAAPIRSFEASISQTVTMSECTLNSGTAENLIQGYEAQLGTQKSGTVYMKFTDALAAANQSSEATTITLLKDITISTVAEITNAITINGNGHVVETTVQHAIQINYAGTVKLKNIGKLSCNQTQSAIQVVANANLELKDIYIEAKTDGTTNFQYGLILVKPSAATDVTLNLNNVDVLMELGTEYGANDHAVIRTGNAISWDHAKKVIINLEDCEWNLTGAPNRHGIIIMDSTTATVNLKKSTISTKNVIPILDHSANSQIEKTESTLTCADAVAQIGDTPYMDFATALSKASAGSTIELLKDINVPTFNITKDLTIDGNGNTITFAVADNSNHGITVNAACTLELKNMDIVHNKAGSITQIYSAGADVRLTNVDVYANTAANYTHALFNMLGKSDELVTKLSLDTVTVTMATNGTASDNAPAIIRTGNGGEGKNVQITIKGSTLDTTGASARYGIVIMPATNATVNLEKSTITTKDAAPIRTFETSISQTVTMSDCTLDSGTAENTLQGYQALTGSQGNGTAYTKFVDALVAANSSEDDITIGLLSGITVTNAVFNNTNGRKITFDGNGHEVTAQGTSYIFPVKSDVEFRNMTITHTGTKEIIYVETAGTTLSLINVTINATSANYERSLINAKVDADLYLTNVIVDMDAAAYANEANKAIIRTGNDDVARTVNIKLDNCNLDTTGATGRSGIVIMAGTTSTITLNGGTIATKDSCPILDLNGSTKILKTKKAVLSCTDFEAQIGTVLYPAYNNASSAANQSSTDVTIELLADITMNNSFSNENGKQITLDGNNHTVTTTTEYSVAFHIQTTCDVELKNMEIVHKSAANMLQIDKSGATVKLTDVTVDATNPNDNSYKNYRWTLIQMNYSSNLYLERVQVDMDVTVAGDGGGEQSAIIRTGNNEGTAKDIVIQLDNSILDATGALGRSGILIVNAEASIVLVNNSKILTQNETYCAAIQGYAGTKKAAISISKDSLLQSGDSTAKKDTIKNLDKGSGVSDGCTWISQKYENVTTFRTSNGLKAPNVVPTGYVFAGWFTDKQCTAKNALSQEDITTTSAYAKFVPDHVLSVKAQVSVNLIDNIDTNDGDGAIRFVTSVDSLDYQKVGFKYNIKFNTLGTKSNEKSSNVVYDTLYVVGSNGEVSDYVPEQLFCEVSEWFKAFTVTGVPSEEFASEFTIQPFWITLDGTKVYGQEVTKTINEGIEKSKLDDGDGDVSETPETTYTNRVVLVSDMHYTTNLTREEYNNKYKLHLWWNNGAGASYAAGPAFGYSQDEKIQCILDDIDALQTSGKHVDSVMVLGDLSLDDYGYRQLDRWYMQDFKTIFMDKLLMDCWAIPGNHDSYTNSDWKNVFGTDRQYSVKVGDAAFIMLDTFAATTATSASGSAYKGVDITWLKNEVAKYPTEQIFLCSHYYEPSASDTEFNELLAENDRIVCMFRGHSHINGFYTSSGMADNALFDIGGYAYNGMEQDDGSYEFNTFDPTWAWGYQVLEWNDTEVHTYHVKPARTYTDCNGVVINYAGAVENDMVIRIGQ